MSRAMKNSGIPWIGEIPEGWKVERTKNVLECGKEIVGAQSANTQLLSLTTKGIRRVEMGSTSGKVPDSYDTYQVVHPGNMVFCLFDLDCSAVFSGVSQYDGMISPAYKVTTLLNNHCPKFYGYWFDYIFDGRKYMFLSKNIRYSLTYDEFAALGIVSPPYAEQQAIADFLDKKCAEIDQMVALQEKFIEELKAYKQSLITETVTKGLNPNAPMKDSHQQWLGAIPRNWGLRPIKYIFSHRREKNEPIKSKKRLSLSIGTGITLYSEKTTNLDRFKDEFTQYQLAYPNDIVLNCMNMIVGAVGRSEYFGCVSPVYYVIYPTYNDNSYYYAYLLNTPIIRGVYHALGQGIYAIERGEGRVNTCRLKVPYEDFSRIEIPVPPIDEQQKIADFLYKKCKEIDALILVKQQKANELKEYKKSIIYEYVTGKRSVCE